MIAVTREPIDIPAMNAAAGHEACGAVLTFSGTVRNHHLGRKVERLAYEAYEGMADKELARVVEEARRRWPDLKKAQVVHRFGEMDVGESSIYITVATPHRPQGFEALRFIIDTIKRDVPIWKKEFYEDGESDWLHPDDGCCGQHLHLKEHREKKTEKPPFS